MNRPALAHNLALVDRLERLATAKGVTPAQLAIAWVLHQGEHIVPIAGTKRVHWLEENVAAARVHLTREEAAHIGDVVGAPAGQRYDAGGMRAVGV